MKTITALIVLYFIIAIPLWGQSDSKTKKGTYFVMSAQEYFIKVIKPWKYQYTQAETDSVNEIVKKIGQITFWRSPGIYDNLYKNYWTPDISFDIYNDLDSNYIKLKADSIKSLSDCDSINKGGDVFLLGHFILFNSSKCVNCASSSKIDYCRNIIRRILESVKNKRGYDWNFILKQLIIDSAKFKT